MDLPTPEPHRSPGSWPILESHGQQAVVELVGPEVDAAVAQHGPIAHAAPAD